MLIGSMLNLQALSQPALSWRLGTWRVYWRWLWIRL